MLNSIDADAKILWDYLQLHQVVQPAEALFVLCSYDIRVADYAANLFCNGYASQVIFSGGIGPKTVDFDKPEADVFAERAIKQGVSYSDIIIENKSKNTGENVRYTYDLCQRRGNVPSSFILVQKPYMERRTYATFRKQWPDPSTHIIVTSPPFLYEEYFDEVNTKQRVINTMVGDLQRIREYPKLGFQIEQHIPEKVLSAYKRLITAGYNEQLL